MTVTVTRIHHLGPIEMHYLLSFVGNGFFSAVSVFFSLVLSNFVTSLISEKHEMNDILSQVFSTIRGLLNSMCRI